MSKKATIGVTQSPYKNILGEPWKSSFQDLHLSALTTESWGMTCGEEYLAFTQQSQAGVISIVKLNDIGRNPPLLRVTGHRGPIEDLSVREEKPNPIKSKRYFFFQSNPFEQTIFASASDDCTVKIWRIPDQANWKNPIKPEQNLVGHTKKVYFCKWNPVASNIIASGATDPSVVVWDVETSKQVLTVAQPAFVMGIAWNTQGSLLSCVTKDKMLRVVDPRQQSIASATNAHDGAKSAKTVWIDGEAGDPNLLLTTGFTRTAGREMKIWDIRRLNSAVTIMPVDSGSGFLLPHWEESTGLLFIVPRGDTYIRPFVWDNGSLIKLDDFRDKSGHRSMAFLPTRCVNVMKAEIVRCYKGDEGGTSILPISFCVHRKDDSKFHDDLYPPCFNGKPALEAAAWFGGENSDPLRSKVTAEGLGSAVLANASHKKLVRKPSLAQSKNGSTKTVGRSTSLKPKSLETTRILSKPSVEALRAESEIATAAETPVESLVTSATESPIASAVVSPTESPLSSPLDSPIATTLVSSTKTKESHTEVPKTAQQKHWGAETPKSEAAGKQSSTDQLETSAMVGKSNKTTNAVPTLDFSKLEQQLKDARSVADSLLSLVESAMTQLDKTKQEQMDYINQLEALGVKLNIQK